MSSQSYVPMVEITRGSQVESLHRGIIAVVDSHGHLVASLGNPKEPVFVRSSAKPFQALALVCSGAADAFRLTDEELAIVCASHSGEPHQVELVQSLMRKSGVDASELRCGVHPPFDAATRRALLAAGQEPTVLHNNCSGKHVGMLATARHLGLPTAGYTESDHSVQIAIRGLLAFLAGLEIDEIGVAVDGCTVPTFHLPLRSFALAMARLAAAGESVGAGPDTDDSQEFEDDGEDSEEFDDLNDEDPNDDDLDEYELAEEEEILEDGFPVSVPEGLTRIWRAMKDHPVLVAGSRGRLCTDLMRVAGSMRIPLVAKSGAEGFYAIAVVHRGEALGIALKVEDGAERARNAAAIETLIQLGVLPEEAGGPLAGYYRPVVLDRGDNVVGEVVPRFRLNRGLPG